MNHGMSINVKIICFFSLQALLLAILFTNLWWMLDSAQRLSDLQLSRYESRELVEELRQSSDDLTRMVRTYVVTGDERYLDYFHKIIAIRDGKLPRPENYQDVFWDYISARHDYRERTGRKVSIVELMKEQQFSAEELARLTAAKKHSDDLVELETRAFWAMQGRIPGDDGTYSTGPPDRELALQLLHDNDYHKAKAEIMVDIDAVLKQLDTRTMQEVALAEESQKHPLRLAILLSIILLGMNVAGYSIFHKDINSPLRKILSWIKYMREGNYDFEVSSFKNNEIGTLARTFAEMAHQVSDQIDNLEHLSCTDPLTQITNRIALDKVLYDEKYRFERYASPCSIILLDIDHFKAVNDCYGHMLGDRVLVAIADILCKSTRESDLVGRWGGEEFMVICPNTDMKRAKIVAELIRKRVDEHRFEEVGHVTVSLGVSEFIRGSTIEAIINIADKALYEAKGAGRNCIR